MQDQGNQLDTTIFQYELLPSPPELNEDLLGQLDANIKGNWKASHQCITMIRSICKTYPQFIPDIFSKYGPAILDLFNQAAAQLLKNILKLLVEVFRCGVEVNLEGCVNAFLPQLAKKAALETGHIKQICQEVLTVVASKCCYCNTIERTTQLSCDKNSQIAQIAIKLLAGILSSIANNLTQISPSTLQIIMRGMSCLINGKRNTMKTSALDICIFIYTQIGTENYLQLMNYSLPQEDVASMTQAMDSHRTQKAKGPQLADVLKQHKIQRQSGVWQNIRM